LDYHLAKKKLVFGVEEERKEKFNIKNITTTTTTATMSSAEMRRLRRRTKEQREQKGPSDMAPKNRKKKAHGK